MDPKKLQNIAKDLNTFMHDKGFMADVSIKIIWERIMSCIAQVGHAMVTFFIYARHRLPKDLH